VSAIGVIIYWQVYGGRCSRGIELVGDGGDSIREAGDATVHSAGIGGAPTNLRPACETDFAGVGGEKLA
jgi:hypothetical protein